MNTSNDIHHQFAHYFKDKIIYPFAYLLSKHLSEGSVCVDLNELPKIVEEEGLEIKIEGNDLYKNLSQTQLVSFDEEEIKPFVVNKNKIYFQRYFYYESVIFQKINHLIASEKDNIESRKDELWKHKNLIDSMFQKKSKETDWQKIGALNAYLKNFMILTGGPGTGKTTTIAKCLSLLLHQNPNFRIALTAPTGKAAVRMKESLQNFKIEGQVEIENEIKTLEPSTIHRLLKPERNSPYFKHNKINTLPFDVIIVDECSMIDIALFAKLLLAIPENSKVILLGDKDQLSSVEAGSILGDICKSVVKTNTFEEDEIHFFNELIEEKDAKLNTEANKTSRKNIIDGHLVELIKSHRFDSNKGIGKLSRAILSNNKLEIIQYIESNSETEIKIDTSYSNLILKKFIENYHSFIEEKDIKKALEKLNQCKILCAVREGEQGIYNTNKLIEKELIKSKKITIDGEFYENRPIMVTQNNAEIGIFNGDIGLMRKDDNGNIQVYFLEPDGNIKVVLPNFLDKVETVYAMTIHKSQGSEFENILIILPPKEQSRHLTRELIYTAITRTKKSVTIQGSKENILEICARVVKRNSGLAERFTTT